MNREENTKKVTSQTLVLIAVSTSETMDKFSNWLVLGLGGIIGLLVSNISQLTGYVDIHEIKISGVIYIFIFLLGFIQKLLFMRVSASAAGYRIAMENTEEKGVTDYDGLTVIDEIKKATLPGLRWMVTKGIDRSIQEIKAGNHYWTHRWTARFSQIQMLVVLLEALLTLWVVIKLVLAIEIGM